jgi:hypothetical protein
MSCPAPGMSRWWRCAHGHEYRRSVRWARLARGCPPCQEPPSQTASRDDMEAAGARPPPVRFLMSALTDSNQFSRGGFETVGSARGRGFETRQTYRPAPIGYRRTGGATPVTELQLSSAPRDVRRSRRSGIKFLLPDRRVAAPAARRHCATRTREVGCLTRGSMILDAAPRGSTGKAELGSIVARGSRATPRGGAEKRHDCCSHSNLGRVRSWLGPGVRRVRLSRDKRAIR